MKFLSKESGFKSVRDYLLCGVGLSICIYHILTTPPQDLNAVLLTIFGGMATSPMVLRHDEKKG